MRGLIFVAAMASASSAWAGDKLAIAPPAAWVKPVALPASDKPSGTPIKLVLLDQQADLQPGRTTRYSEIATRIQTPEGLSAGAVAFSWDPAIDSVTVHKLQIRRGGQVIDVLAGGQSFTVVRRERNLEFATLDGVLTATLQPEGLQVGDVVDFAWTVSSSDPALGRHVEELAAAWNGFVIGRAHSRVQWPSSVPMRLKAAGGLAMPEVKKQGDLSSIELAQDDVQPLLPPKDAPDRYKRGRRIELTDFSSWSDLGELFAPLYVKAEKLAPNGPLRGEIARIAAASRDPVARAEAALALVQDRVRYVALLLNNGGLIPADADATWSRRFGDCKGKTVLLLAILHELGIHADPVIVGPLGDGLDQGLPMVFPFNHVIVRATIGGRDYWLDGTRQGDRKLAGIETPNFRWGLPLVANGAKLVAMVPPPRASPDTDVTVRIDATKGIIVPAAIHVERLIRGDEAIMLNLAISSVSGDERDRYLRDFFKERFDSLDVKTVTAGFDPDKRELKLVMDGAITMDWSDGWYRVDIASVGYKADFRRDAGPDRDAPFAVSYPSWFHVAETIDLPPKSGAFALYDKSTNVDQTVAGVSYKRIVKLDGSRFTVDESERAVAPEFPFSDAPAAQAMLRDLDNRPVVLSRPNAYSPTAEEIAAIETKPPVTSEDYLRRGIVYGQNRKYDLALADFTKAIELQPDNAIALGARGLLYTMTHQMDLADRDATAALAIEPSEQNALRVRLAVAQAAGRFNDIISASGAILKVAPADAYALQIRAEVEGLLKDNDAALADAGAALKVNPKLGDLYLLRANIYRRKGDAAAAQREADAAIAALPDNDYVLVAAGKLYAAYGRRADAKAAFDRALKVKPAAYVYLNRGEARERGDLAGRQADIDAALKLDPRMAEAWIDQAQLDSSRKNWPKTIDAASKAAALKPDDLRSFVLRAIAYKHLGDQAHAEADMATARGKAKSAEDLNELCWFKATLGIAADSALADCDAALALAPGSAHILDSRGFVLLRLDRNDEAISTYNRALTASPKLAQSLFGRAVAESRVGDKAASDRDLAAALALSPKVREEFSGYGVEIGKPPAEVASTPAPTGAAHRP